MQWSIGPAYWIDTGSITCLPCCLHNCTVCTGVARSRRWLTRSIILLNCRVTCSCCLYHRHAASCIDLCYPSTCEIRPRRTAGEDFGQAYKLCAFSDTIGYEKMLACVRGLAGDLFSLPEEKINERIN